jgi:hypothetical protein
MLIVLQVVAVAWTDVRYSVVLYEEKEVSDLADESYSALISFMDGTNHSPAVSPFGPA